MFREFEVWDQWHNLGVSVFSFNGKKITKQQRRTLTDEPDLAYVFNLGLRLGQHMLNYESEAGKKSSSRRM